MFRKMFVLVAVAGVASGCVSTGNQTLSNETEASVGAKLTEGQTTKAQVQQMFGSPSDTSFTSNAEEIWTYSLTDMQLGVENFIPYVGMLGGTASGTEKRLVILFGQNDVVRRYTMTEGAVETRTGVYNQ